MTTHISIQTSELPNELPKQSLQPLPTLAHIKTQQNTQIGKLQPTLTQIRKLQSQQNLLKKHFKDFKQPLSNKQQQKQAPKQIQMKHSPLFHLKQKFHHETQKRKHHLRPWPHFQQQQHNLSKWTKAQKSGEVKDSIENKEHSWNKDIVFEHKADSLKETLQHKKQDHNKNIEKSSVTHKKLYDTRIDQQKKQSHNIPSLHTTNSQQSIEMHKRISENPKKPKTHYSSATGNHHLIKPETSAQLSGPVITQSANIASSSHATILQHILDLLRYVRQSADRKLVLALQRHQTRTWGQHCSDDV